MGNQVFVIPADQLPEVERKASSGDGQAARRLSRYYSMILLDMPRARFWMEVSAISNIYVSMLDFALYLDQFGNKNDKVRAVYWLEKVVKGSPDESLRQLASSRLQPLQSALDRDEEYARNNCKVRDDEKLTRIAANTVQLYFPESKDPYRLDSRIWDLADYWRVDYQLRLPPDAPPGARMGGGTPVTLIHKGTCEVVRVWHEQ